MRQRSSGGVHAARAVHAPARMGRGRGKVEPVNRRTGTTKTGYRAKDQLLVERCGTAVDGAADEACIAAL